MGFRLDAGNFGGWLEDGKDSPQKTEHTTQYGKWRSEGESHQRFLLGDFVGALVGNFVGGFVGDLIVGTSGQHKFVAFGVPLDPTGAPP
jgi:hypothetical protein